MSFYLLFSKKHKNLGATLAENLVSFTIVTTTISVMTPIFFSQKEENVNQKFLTGAINLSKEHLDDLRRQKIIDLPLGKSTIQKETSGYSYELKQYICTEEPIVNADQSVTCKTTIEKENNLRHIILSIEKNEKQIYKFQTAFTRLR
ncbi:type II secretion system protein [Crocosphaera watsonii]|nr:type II secretion system protein [Crocosphaera watsonii]